MQRRTVSSAFLLGFVMCVGSFSAVMTSSGESDVLPDSEFQIGDNLDTDEVVDVPADIVKPMGSKSGSLRTVVVDSLDEAESLETAGTMQGARMQVVTKTAQATDSSTDVHVTGCFQYQSSETPSGYAPVQYGVVKIYDSEVLKDEFLGWTYTWSDGSFEFVVNNDDGAGQGGRDLYVKSLSKNQAASVEHWSWTEAPPGYVPYEHQTTTWDNAADGSYIDLGTKKMTEDVNAWYIADMCRFARDWVYNSALYTVDRARVLWPLPWECDAFTDTPHVHILPNVGEDLDPFHGDIHISKHTDYNWDRKTIFHEYAHHVMHCMYSGEAPFSFVWNWFTPHDAETEVDDAFALIEGWAEFLESAIDWNINDPTSGLVVCDGQNIEDNRWYEKDGLTLDGSRVEGSVASILWDMFDPTGNLGPLIENHYGDQMCVSVYKIFQTFLATQTESIYGLWDYWHDLSYINLDQLQSTYEGMYSAFMNYGVNLGSKPLPPLPYIVSPSRNSWFSGVVPLEATFIDPDGGLTRAIFTVEAPDLGPLQFVDEDGSDGWTATWDPGSYSSAISNVVVSVQGVEDNAPGGPLWGYEVETSIGVDTVPPKVSAFTDPMYPSILLPTKLKVKAYDWHSGLQRVTLFGKLASSNDFIHYDFDGVGGTYFTGEISLDPSGSSFLASDVLPFGTCIDYYAEVVDRAGHKTTDPESGYYEFTVGKQPGKLVLRHVSTECTMFYVTDPLDRKAGWNATLVYKEIPDVVLDATAGTIGIPYPIPGGYVISIRGVVQSTSYSTNVTSYSDEGPVLDSLEWTGDYRNVKVVLRAFMGDEGTLLKDGRPPETEVVKQGKPGPYPWYTSDVLVTLHAFDRGSGVKSTYYNTSWSDEWTEYTGPFTLGQCVCRLGYYSVDYCGNREEPKFIWIDVDETNPTIAGEVLPQANLAGWHNGNVTVHFTAQDAYSGLKSVTPDQVLTHEGTNLYVEGVAVDAAGNTATCNISGMNIDWTCPSTRIIVGQPNSRNETNTSFVTSQTNLTLKSIDKVSGGRITYYRINGSDWIQYQDPFVLQGPERYFFVEAYSVDWADNIGPIESMSIVIDSVPTAAFTVFPLAGYVNTNHLFDASSCTDSESPASSLQTSWDFNGDGIWDTDWSTTKSCSHKFSTSGEFIVGLGVRDTVGLLNTTTRLVKILVDGKAPTTSLTVLGVKGSTEWYNSSITVSLAAVDLESGVDCTYYRIDNGSWQAFSDDLQISSDGVHVIEYGSMDMSGNNETASETTFMIDKAKPTLVVSEHLKDKYTKDQVALSWTGSDATSGIDHYEYSLDGDAFVDLGNATEVTLSSLSDGSHDVVIRGVDKAGNVAELAVTFSVNTSILSTGGPMGPLLLIVTVAAVVVVAAGSIWLWKFKKGGAPKPPASGE